MQEFGITVTEALKQGLPPDERAEARGDYVSKLVNVRPTAFGAEGIGRLTIPAGVYGRMDWPFPQIFYGSRYTFLCTRTSIFLVKEGHERQLDNVSAVSTIKWDSVNTQVDIPAGGRWHFADMGEAFYFYNGKCVVFSLFNEFSVESPRAWINKDVPINCGTKFKGRNVFGGLGDGALDHFTSLLSEVSAAENSLADDGANLPLDPNTTDFRPNHVMWSSIGGGDFPAWLFWPEPLREAFFSNEGSWGPSWDDVRKRFKRNQLGWLELPFQGEVKNLVPLGNTAVIAYCESHVSALIPTSGGGEDVPATFGRQTLSNIGVHSRGAIAKSKGSHLFLGNDGRLRVITGDLEVQELGYQQYLEDFDEAVIEYEPREGEFYISDGDRAFCFKDGAAFYEHAQAVTSFESIKGETRAAVQGTGHASADIETSLVDFGQVGHKTITQVGVDYRGPYAPYVAVAYRYDSDDPLQVTDWEQLGPDNTVPIRVTAKEFKALIYFPSYEDLEIDDIRVRFQLPDKRFTRGTRANPVNS